MSTHDDIQARDTTDTRTAVRNTLRQQVQRRRYEESLDIEATVRTLIKRAELAISGTTEEVQRPPEEILEELHLYLWLDPNSQQVFAPDHPPDARTVYQWQEMHQRFEQGFYIDPVAWLEVLADIAKAMEFATAYSDLSQYAPVELEHLDKRGARLSVDAEDVTPVGRLRLPKDTRIPPEEREPVIPHTACDHVLTVAIPRSGKDSTGARICGTSKTSTATSGSPSSTTAGTSSR